jgi:tetratricopeptide (TPR) repeat protein
MQPTATKAKAAPMKVAAVARVAPPWAARLAAGLLVLVTMTVYWPAVHCDFVNYDDREFVSENPQVQAGLNWEGVKWAFCNTEQPAYWAPLMWLSHMLTWHFWGGNAWGHHLVNVLLHSGNTALVFLVLQRLTGATWRSLVVAALFGLHPLRVESVAWVTERKDVLSGCFSLLALMAYARYTEKAEGRGQRPDLRDRRFFFRLPSSIFYLLSLFLFALGLMSKPALPLTLPGVLLLLDYWPLGRLEGTTCHSPRATLVRLVKEKIPFLVLAAVASVATITAQKQGGNLASKAGLPLGARTGNALISYGRYLAKLFWPRDLAVFYPCPRHWPLGQVLVAGGLLLGVTVLLFVQRRRCPFLLMGWLWFLGTLVPVIGLVQAGSQAMADRFAYLPSLGVLIVAIWGASELARPWHSGVRAFWVASAAVIFLCLALTRQQLGYWQDSEALFRHALAVTEGNWLAHNNLGYTLDEKGHADDAIRQYQAALQVNPDYADAHNNLGAALYQKGQCEEAIRHYQAALRLQPAHAGAHKNLGLALGKKGQVDGAVRQYQEAMRLKPDDADLHTNLGVALAMQGRIDEAIGQFQAALRLKPDNSEAHYNLGRALDLKGQTDEAIGQFQATLRLKPGYADAHNNLGLALNRKGQRAEAISEYREAIRLRPDHAEAHNNLGIAFYQQGRTGEAIRQFEEALRAKPDFAAARKNLDLVLASRAPLAPPRGATNP